jgi:hypothetical protein
VKSLNLLRDFKPLAEITNEMAGISKQGKSKVLDNFLILV